MFGFRNGLVELTAPAARQQILAGRAPRAIRVSGAGRLNLSRALAVRRLPERIQADSIDISHCANLHAISPSLECRQLLAAHSGLENLPAGLRVSERIDLEGCRRLRSVGVYDLDTLILRGCTALENLPEGLRVRQLDVSRCSNLAGFPRSVLASVERLDISHSPQWTTLPTGFARLQGINVSGCANLTEVPWGTRIRSWIDVAGSGLRSLPISLSSVRVLWHGVFVPDRVAFDPDSITVDEILRESNQEVRRVLLERVGMEWFFRHARPRVIDQDTDAGGIRRLLRIDAGMGEPILCVQVRCPSTGSSYLLRVPPETLTCQEAIAWTAGFRNPHNYCPIVET